MTIFDKIYHFVMAFLEFLLSFSILFAVCTSSELGRPTQFFLLGCAACAAASECGLWCIGLARHRWGKTWVRFQGKHREALSTKQSKMKKA